MIYKGPGIFSDLANGLERLLVSDGYLYVKDAVGVCDAKSGVMDES